jgi:hypothetical protein
MASQNKKTAVRKAIFVSEEVFAKFKAAANDDNRSYGAFLEVLLDTHNNTPAK